MATERLDIVVSQKGESSRVIARNIEDIGRSAASVSSKIDRLSSSYAQALSQISRLRSSTSRFVTDLRQISPAANSASGGLFSLNRLLATLGVTLSASKFAEFLNTSAELKNRLRAIADEGENTGRVFNRLTEISNGNRTGLEVSVRLYQRSAAALEDLGLSQEAAFRSVDLFTKALIVGGASAKESSQAIYQLTQAIGSGRLQGEELRAVLEEFPFFARLIAQELKVPFGSLRELAKEGKITSDVMIRSIGGAADEIESRFRNRIPTISEQFVVLRNNVVVAAGKFDEATGASAKLVAGIEFLGNNVQRLDGLLLALAITTLPSAISAFVRFGAVLLSSPLGIVAASIGVVTGAVVSFRNELSITADGLPTLGKGIFSIADVFNSLGKSIKDVRGIDFKDIVPIVNKSVRLGPASDTARLDELVRERKRRLRDDAEEERIARKATQADIAEMQSRLESIKKLRDILPGIRINADRENTSDEAQFVKDFRKQSDLTVGRLEKIIAIAKGDEESLKKAIASIKDIEKNSISDFVDRIQKKIDESSSSLSGLGGQVPGAGFGSVGKLAGEDEANSRAISRAQEAVGLIEKATSIGAAIDSVINRVRSTIAGILSFLITGFTELFNLIQIGIDKVFGGLANKLSFLKGGAGLLNAVLPGLGILNADIDGLLSGLTRTSEKFQSTSVLANVMSKSLQSAAESAKRVADTPVNAFEQLLRSITENAAEAGILRQRNEELAKSYGDVKDAIQSTKAATDELKNAGKGAADSLETVIQQRTRANLVPVPDPISELRKKVKDGLTEPIFKPVEDQARDSFNEVRRLVQSTFSHIEDSLVTFVQTGKFSFSSLVNSMIGDITRLAFRALIVKPLLGDVFGVGSDAGFGVGTGRNRKNTFTGGFGGLFGGLLGGGGGGLGGLLGGLFGFRDGGLVGYATGGEVSGSGTGTSDSVLLRASRGEFIVNAAATANNRPLLESINSGKSVVGETKTVVFSPNIGVTVSGDTQDGKRIGSEVASAIKQQFAEMLRQETRPGGILATSSRNR